MITLIFDKEVCLEVFKDGEIIKVSSLSIGAVLSELLERFPLEIYLWIDVNIDRKKAENLLLSEMKHERMLVSLGSQSFINEELGYVELHPTFSDNYNVPHDNWLIGTLGGMIYGKHLVFIKDKLRLANDFQYEMNSFSRLAKPLGLISRRIPFDMAHQHYNSDRVLYQFVGAHYKKGWLFFLFVNQCYYQRKFPLVDLCRGFFSKRRSLQMLLTEIPVKKHVKRSVDVIIPTFHRKETLYLVLQDLAKQEHLPDNVILIEQNEIPNATSQLNYIDENWPFKIIHHFTHQAGACRARNLGMKELLSDYVFFADDDIRIPSDFIKNALQSIQDYSAGAMTFSCLQKNEEEKEIAIRLSDNFGSGCSLVESKWLADIRFDEGFEHGYGEDNDFGMQLRKKGCTILFNPFEKLLHLKAPVGGFRKSVPKAWDTHEESPKPSPTIMLFVLKHYSLFQKRGYKSLLFIQFYKVQPMKNPFRYIRMMKKRWATSVLIAGRLKTQNQ